MKEKKNGTLKRLIRCLSVALFLLGFSLFADAAALGDINGDGEISAADARLALRYAVSLEKPDARQRLAADADHDSSLSAADARLILRVVVELEAFTHPFNRADHTVTVVKAPTCAEKGVLHTVCVCGAVREDPIPRTEDHAFPAEWTPKTPAGCEEQGVNEKLCTVCGAALTGAIPPLGHLFEEKETKASCEKEGLVQSVCARCGKIAANRTLPPLGHTLTETVTTAPTCTGEGAKRLRCGSCGYTAFAVMPALGHDFAKEYTEERAAACTEPGVRSRRCSRCSAVTDSVPVPATGHSFTVCVVPAACAAPGEEKEICERCGAVGETRTLPAAGHSYLVDAEEIADCTLGGIRRLVCAVCGEASDEVIPAAPHSFSAGAVETTKASCLKAGRQTFRCAVCGMTQTTEIPALEHQKIRVPAADAAPTCTDPGKEGYVCALCGADLSVEIAASGHTPRVVKGALPTCTADGSSDETVCAECGETLTASVPLPAAGHSFSAWETDAAGVLTRRCLICGETETRTPLCSHIYIETAKTPPGCETTGALVEICSLCGDEKRTLLPPAGHDYQGQTVAPTCTEAGYTRYTCKNCKKTSADDPVPALGHSGALRGRRAASCAAAGYSGDLVCSRCGKTLQTGAVLPALPHTPADSYTTEKAFTCTENGLETLRCAVCKTVLDMRTVPAPGHDISYQYENNGTVRKTVCGRCGATLETAAVSAVLITADGKRTDVFDPEQTLSTAAPGSKVVLTGDHTLRRSVTVPAGVCFVIPCFAGDPGYTEAGGIPDGTATENGDTESLYCTLTVPEDCTLTVEGTLLVNARTGRRMPGPGADQNVSGGYGEIALQGRILVKDGGCLDCAGYVNASPSGTDGAVTLLPGAVLYETAEILRFRGAANALNSAVLGVYPVYEQSLRSVRARLIVSCGASVFGRTKLCAPTNEEETLYPALFPLIGEAGLFRIAEGGTAERIVPDGGENAGRIVYRFRGGALTQGVEFTPLPGMTLQTGEYLYPVNGDCSLVFAQGAYTLDAGLLLLPGAGITVEEGASLQIPAGRKLVLADGGFYEKDALVGDCAYPAGRAPAALCIAEGGAVTVYGTLAGQKIAGNAHFADGAAKTAVITVPTSPEVSAAHQKEYEVTVP